MNIRYLLIAGLALAAALFAFIKFGHNPSAESDKVGTTTPTAEMQSVAGDYSEGVHYRAVKGSDANKANKIQVQEFFWYGCHHCEAFEPAVLAYKKTIASDVELVQIPVIWNEPTALHASIFYLAQSKNAPDEIHADLFRTIMSLRKEGNPDIHIQEAAKVFASHGLDTDNFKDQLQSTEIQAELANSQQLMKSFEISGTPTVVVDGSWAVLNAAEVSSAGFFNVVDFLVEKARADR